MTAQGSVLAPNLILPTLIMVENNAVIPIYNPCLIVLNGLQADENGLIDRYQVECYLEENFPLKLEIVTDLIECESGFDERKCGDNGTSCGILQYKEQTFLSTCEGEWKNSEDQIKCAVKMIDMGIGDKLGGWYNCWRIQNLFKYDY
jgi:hypothetical protein